MIPLLPNNYYHVFNRANGDSVLFYCDDNYEYFLRKFSEHTKKSFSLISYCLLPNHFHFLVKALEHSNSLENSKLFSNFFNCYTKSINKQQNRSGSLFQKPFKRRLIVNEDYLRIVVNYIHRNPIHHNVAYDLEHYEWSSFDEISKNSSPFIDINEILNMFGSLDDFKLQVSIAIENYKDLNIE